MSNPRVARQGPCLIGDLALGVIHDVALQTLLAVGVTREVALAIGVTSEAAP